MLGPPRSPARPLVSSVSRSLLRARRFVRGHRPFPPVSVHSGPQSFKHTPTDWCPRRFTPRSQCSRAPRPFARPPDRPAIWSSIPPGPCFGPRTPAPPCTGAPGASPRAPPHLAVGTDEEGLHFDAVADHGHSGAGGDGGGIAGGGGDDGVGHPGTAQSGGDGAGLGEGLGPAAGRWHMAHGVVGGGEGRAGVLDTDHGGLLERRGLLGWPIPAWGEGEAVWNQSLWPNLQREGQVHGQTDTRGGGGDRRGGGAARSRTETQGRQSTGPGLTRLRDFPCQR